MLANALEFGPNTAEAHKKLIYGIFDPRALLTAYRTARREYKTADLVLVTRSDEIFAGPRVSMSAHLQTLKFPAPLVSAHSKALLPQDHEAFWLIVPVDGCDIPAMVVMYVLQYEQVAEGQSFAGEA